MFFVVAAVGKVYDIDFALARRHGGHDSATLGAGKGRWGAGKGR